MTRRRLGVEDANTFGARDRRVDLLRQVIASASLCLRPTQPRSGAASAIRAS